VKTSKTKAAGKEPITGFYQAGEFFGYQALLEHVPHHDTAVALEASTLCYIPAEEFYDFLLRLHEPAGAPIQLTREDLAAVVGTAPES
jgi:CRP-like cAMP-binding protein